MIISAEDLDLSAGQYAKSIPLANNIFTAATDPRRPAPLVDQPPAAEPVAKALRPAPLVDQPPAAEPVAKALRPAPLVDQPPAAEPVAKALRPAPLVDQPPAAEPVAKALRPALLVDQPPAAEPVAKALRPAPLVDQPPAAEPVAKALRPAPLVDQPPAAEPVAKALRPAPLVDQPPAAEPVAKALRPAPLVDQPPAAEPVAKALRPAPLVDQPPAAEPVAKALRPAPLVDQPPAAEPVAKALRPAPLVDQPPAAEPVAKALRPAPLVDQPPAAEPVAKALRPAPLVDSFPRRLRCCIPFPLGHIVRNVPRMSRGPAYPADRIDITPRRPGGSPSLLPVMTADSVGKANEIVAMSASNAASSTSWPAPSEASALRCSLAQETARTSRLISRCRKGDGVLTVLGQHGLAEPTQVVLEMTTAEGTRRDWVPSQHGDNTYAHVDEIAAETSTPRSRLYRTLTEVSQDLRGGSGVTAVPAAACTVAAASITQEGPPQ